MSEQAAPLLGERFELKEAVRDGRAFKLHAGYDRRTGRPVRVRILKPYLAREPEVRVAFRRLPDSPPPPGHGLLRILAVEQYQDTLAVVEETPDGPSLYEVLQGAPVMDPLKAVELTRKLADAIEPLHAAGVAHAMLSPHEVHVVQGGEFVEISGTGLSRPFAGHGLPGADENPYVMRGQDPSAFSPQCDVYSLAVMLVQCVTGRCPSRGDLRSGGGWRRGVPSPLQDAVHRALAPTSREGFASAVQFANALEDALSGVPAPEEEPGGDEETAEPSADVADPLRPRLPGTRADRTGAEAGAVGKRGPGAAKPRLSPALVSCLASLFFALLIPAAVGIPVYSAYMHWLHTSPAELQVPDLQSGQMRLEDARERLAPMKLKLRVVDEVYNPEIGDGRIVWQNPAPGRTVKEGRTIDVKVSRGAAAVQVPNIVNVSQEQAEEALKEQRLVLGEVLKGNSRSFPAGIVLSQSPGAGRTIYEGGQVNVLVSEGPSASENWEDADETDAGSVPSQARFTVPQEPDPSAPQRVQIRVTDARGTRTVYDKLHESGDNVRASFSVFAPGKVEIVYNGNVVDTKSVEPRPTRSG